MKPIHLAFAAGLALTAVSAVAGGPPAMIDVYKSAQCGCCEKWVEHLRENGFLVRAHNVGDVPGERRRLGMPDALGSCHTAKIGAYVIEGHVPAQDIARLLARQPDALGLAVPAMPPGSPGMESARPVPYDTLLVERNGKTRVFASH